MYVRFVFCDYLERIKKTLYGNLTLTILYAWLSYRLFVYLLLLLILMIRFPVWGPLIPHPPSPPPPPGLCLGGRPPTRSVASAQSPDTAFDLSRL